MNEELDITQHDRQEHNRESENLEKQGLFQIVISEREVDQSVLNDINILDVHEQNLLPRNGLSQSPLALELGDTCTEGVAFTLTEEDLDSVQQQLQPQAFQVDLPPKLPKVPVVNCVFCHEVIKAGEQAVACCSGGHPHHLECWQSNGGQCGVHSCGDRQYKSFDVTQLATSENTDITLNEPGDDVASILSQFLRKLSL